MLIIAVSSNAIRLLIPIIVNTRLAIIIKNQIVVNNTSSNYAEIKFKSSFLGYSPNGNCVFTVLDKLTENIKNYIRVECEIIGGLLLMSM